MRRAEFTRAVALGAAGVAFPNVSFGAEPVVLRLGHANSVTHGSQLVSLRFAELVKQKTNGSVEVKVFPNNQLGKQQQVLDGLQTGVVDLSLTNNAFNESLFPDTQVLDLPFIFKSRAAAEKALDGSIGQGLFDEMPAKGIVGLTWLTAGLREMENNVRPIVKPTDLRGLKMRIQTGPVYVAMFKAVGANPVVISAAEVYTALSQHLVDGLEFPLSAFVDDKADEVVKYVSLTHHIYNAIPLLASKAKFDTLTPAQRKALQDSAKEATPYLRELYVQSQARYMDTMAKKGIVLTKDVDRPAFTAAMAPLYDQFRPLLKPGLLDAVLKAGSAA